MRKGFAETIVGTFVLTMLTWSSAFAARGVIFPEAPLELRPGDHLEIVGIRGSVRLQPPAVGAPGQALVRARKTIGATASPAALDAFDKLGFTVRREGRAVRIEPSGMDGAKVDWVGLTRPGMPELNLEIQAPSTPVDIGWRSGEVTLLGWKDAVSVELVEGSFLARRTEGFIRLQMQRGEARIEGHRGRLEASSNAARLSGREIEGDVSAESVNAVMAFQGIEGTVRLRAYKAAASVAKGSGDLEFESSRAPIDVSDFEGAVRGQSEDGPLTIQVTGEPEISVETIRGPITIRLPAGSGATIRAVTEDGRIVVPDPPLRVSVQPGGRSVAGQMPGRAHLGHGSALAKSKSGNILIR